MGIPKWECNGPGAILEDGMCTPPLFRGQMQAYFFKSEAVEDSGKFGLRQAYYQIVDIS
jgi:hypothetical protein